VKKRLIPSIGSSITLSYALPVNNNTHINMVLFPNIKLSYFVNDHIAPYIRAGLNINFLLSKTRNNSVEEFDFADEIELNPGILIGFSYFRPSEEQQKE
jgi:hypothetical protein